MGRVDPRVVAALAPALAAALVTPATRAPVTRLHRFERAPPLGCRPVGTALAALPPDLSAFDPAKFVPVCEASDGFYRALQGAVLAVVGGDVYQEYAPLIAGGLLRVRLELCVVESFVSEAIVPFIQQKGLSWVLPFHETVETFLAGTIFALALNFILVGSMKIVAVVVTYFDFLLGMPSRFLSDRALNAQSWADDKPNQGVTVALTLTKVRARARRFRPPPRPHADPASTPRAQAFGEALAVFRKVIEGVDAFVGKYLAISTAAYITFKFLHFRVFNT